jgi:hypothetical protein
MMTIGESVICSEHCREFATVDIARLCQALDIDNWELVSRRELRSHVTGPLTVFAKSWWSMKSS